METDSTVLDRAIRLVDRECSYLREERRAYVAFREVVRLATPDRTDGTGFSETTERLLATYREEVMETLDHGTVYGNTITEDLEREFSPAIADVLVSKDPLIQRRKRDLLLQSTAAIERRDQFCAELDEERTALETFAEELADVDEAVENLPVCSAREQPLEKLLIVWEDYDTLLERCERLLERRQQQIREAERSVRIFGQKHARNEFLYSELETRYPVLSAIAATCERIDSKRNGERSAESPDGSPQF